MPRTLYQIDEDEIRSGANPWDAVKRLTTELDAEREVSKLLAASLKETRDATAAMMRAMVKVCEPDMVDHITSATSEYNGFGKRASEALAKYREGM